MNQAIMGIRRWRIPSPGCRPGMYFPALAEDAAMFNGGPQRGRAGTGLTRAILELGRAGLSLSVASTAACGALLSGSARDAIVAFFAVWLVAAGASALNQVQECEDDRELARTHRRPIPAGAVSARYASLMAILLLLAGFTALAVGGRGLVPVVLAWVAIALYNGIYTPLKRITTAAILPGAVAGALPPIIGAAVAGAVPLSAVVLAGAVLIWQVPHTWLIELQYRADYLAIRRPTFCRVFARHQMERLVFIWSIAFAALPPVLVVVAGGNPHPLALGSACCVSIALMSASMPLLTTRPRWLSYGRINLLLRACLLLSAGLGAVAAR